MNGQNLSLASRLSTSRAAANRGAALYRHPSYGFALLIPASMQNAPSVQIGNVTLQLRHRSKTIAGRVPPAWLVDLNSDDPQPECPVAAQAVPEPQDTGEPAGGMKHADEADAYLVSRNDLDRLRTIERRLYDGTTLDYDGRRDLAFNVQQIVRSVELCPVRKGETL